MKSYLYSVRILRDENEMRYVKALYLESYFEFCGVYVQECVLSDAFKYNEKSKKNVNLNIWLAEDNSNSASDPFKADVDIYFSEDEIGEQSAEEIVGVFLQKMAAEQILCKTTLSTFEYLKDIFFEQNYIAFNFARRFFLRQLTEEKKKMLSQMYFNCYEELCQYNDKNDEKSSIYIEYARLNCARIMNDVCQSMHNTTDFFKQEIIMKKAVELSMSNTMYTMGKVLAGFIGIKRYELLREGSKYLRDVIEIEEGNPCINFIYHAYGFFLESNYNDYEGALLYFERMLELDPNDFRVIFKRGRIQFVKGDYQAAEASFNLVITLIKNRKNCMPMDLEYAYKSWMFLGWIAGVYMNDSERAAVSELRADEILKEANSRLKFLNVILRNDFPDYGELISSKIKKYKFDYFLKNNWKRIIV